ncbi:MAG: polyprenyl synthetase family protein [Bacteroidetes bacterium]|nr:MAG: polyprenyl synthetase family protein [Bacteroidota bacterium]
MRPYEEYLSYINSEIEKRPFTGNPNNLYEPLNYILTLGGKRMRPVLTLMGCELFGGAMDTALKQALGIEVFHNFTLMHDDIMDVAPLRRGKPTVHVKWNEPTAILAGDLMLIKAIDLVRDADISLQKPLLDIFNQTAIEVCEGQQQDMDFEGRENVTEAEYIEMIRLKTAVLLGCALQTGAMMANATPEGAKNIYRFGELVGIGFQLMDDVLDVFGDNEKVGKQAGGDIISNKKTYLLIKALELAEGETKQQLTHWINVSDFIPAEKVTAVTAIYNTLGIKELATQKSESYFTEAYNLLETIDMPAENKKYLHDFCEWIRTRVS